MLYSVKSRFSIDKIGNALNQFLSCDFDFKGESHDFIEAVFIVTGCVQLTEDGKVYIMNEGDILFHAPMEFHCLKSFAGTSPNIRNLSFTVKGDLPDNLFDGVYHLNSDQRTLFLKCFDSAYEYCTGNKKTKYHGQYVVSKLSVLLIDISARLEVQDASSTEVSALMYSLIVTAMHRSVSENLSLSDFADSCNISVSYLKKLFYHYANASPKTFYNSLRIKESAQMLSEGFSVAEIAEMMHFSSPNYFSSFFKKHFGVSPLEYKKQRC